MCERNSVDNAFGHAVHTQMTLMGTCVQIQVKYLHGMLTLTYKTIMLNYDISTYNLFYEQPHLII